MEYLSLLVILLIVYLMLRIIFGVNIKKIKELGEDKELDKLTQKYTENIEICKEYLKKLDNESVNIEEEKNSDATLYLVVSNKIFIANLKDSYTRIQTIAHECLHSIQNKKMLWFNFIFSNFYILYFLIICILAILKILPFKMMFLAVLILLGFVFYSVRSYLETDAMTNARYLAKDYMEEKQISTKEEINRILKRYDELNDVGIKATNFQLFRNVAIKIIIFTIICIIF